jgi:hypothetical protein
MTWHDASNCAAVFSRAPIERIDRAGKMLARLAGREPGSLGVNFWPR